MTYVEAFLDTSDEIMKLMMTVDAIRRVKPDTQINLHIPYFPYARQDRVCNKGEALAVKVMAEIINSLKVAQVTLYDAHSDVAGALLKNVTIREQHDLVCNTMREFITNNKVGIVAPDAGAEKKALKLVQALELETPLVHGSKKRDTKTGQILATKVYGEVAGRALLIVDDICDGGRTFIELAKVLKAQGATQVYLYVTHGIFSKGTEVLSEHIDQAFCYFAFPNVKPHSPQFLQILNPSNL